MRTVTNKCVFSILTKNVVVPTICPQGKTVASKLAFSPAVNNVFFETISELSFYHRRVQRNFCLLNSEDRVRAELWICSIIEHQYSSFTLKIVSYFLHNICTFMLFNFLRGRSHNDRKTNYCYLSTIICYDLIKLGMLITDTIFSKILYQIIVDIWNGFLKP